MLKAGHAALEILSAFELTHDFFNIYHMVLFHKNPQQAWSYKKNRNGRTGAGVGASSL
jgi:hypothetical protein